ncbi:unnamed protein product [Bursaphelenchus okinawaensis]|uniref:DSL domain-containing protein n=1 Tax=Bursaphelenchus okinawaensis TaxID=465554 RepID=A0A811KPI0_9BILA|nr:unnamed protein product [Bursaphelenchus okinawaensis]CAG9107365.1 unnamed protein product [Bursaphelenchus okinawaensis]
MIFPPKFGEFLLLTLILGVQNAKAAENSTFSESIVYLEGIEIIVTGNYERSLQAHLMLDFKAAFGNLRGSIVTRATNSCALMDTGKEITCRIEQISFMIANPVDAIVISATPSIEYFDNGAPNEIMDEITLFTMAKTTFNETAPTKVSTKIGKEWPITLTYRKACNRDHSYGFQCNVVCLQQREGECYECNPVNGSKICCNDPDVDQDTCLYKNGAIPPPRTCEEKLTYLNSTYESTKARRDLFFWLMLGFILLFVLALLLLIMAVLCAFHQKKKYEESKHFILNRDYDQHSFEQKSYPEAVSDFNLNNDQSKFQIDQYDRSLRRKKHSELTPTPERKRKRLALQDPGYYSSEDYLPFPQNERNYRPQAQRQPYAVSTILPPPPRRRRLEQVV